MPNESKNLFDRLCALIGMSDDSKPFQELTSLLKEEPKMHQRSAKSRLLTFDEVQCGIYFRSIDGKWIIKGTFMTVESSGPRYLKVRELGGNLPQGMCVADGRDIVEKKMGSAPVRTERCQKASPSGTGVWKDSYLFRGLELAFHFDAANGQLCYWLLSPVEINS